MDFVTGLPRTVEGKDAILTFTDRFSKMVHLVAMDFTNSTAPQVARLYFDNVWRLHGLSQKIISDRDPRFMSAFWQEIFRLSGTLLAPGTPYHPQTDGQAENTNRTMEQILRAYVDPRQTDWDRHLSAVEFSINDSRHASSQFTPFHIVYGKELNSQFDLIMESNRKEAEGHQGAGAFMENWRRIMQEVRQNLLKAQVRQKKAYDQLHQGEQFQVGDQVVLKVKAVTAPVHWGTPIKLRQPYMGPYTVIRVIRADDGLPAAYQLRLPNTWKGHDVFSVDKLKPYRSSERWSSRVIPPPPPEVMVEGCIEYVVDKILAHRDVKKRRKGRTIKVREYLVRYEGYGDEFDEWMEERVLNIGGDLVPLMTYKKRERLMRVRTGEFLEGTKQVRCYEEEDSCTHYIDKKGELRLLTAHERQLRFLVLFSGTGSVEKVIAARFPRAEIISLDNNPKWEPTLQCDIADWVQRGEGTMYDYPPGYFDFVWASPPCTEYSRAKTVGVRDLEAADRRVNDTLKALRYLRPRYYVIENPQGLLHERPVMHQDVMGDWLPDMKQQVNYCRYGTEFKKPTHLWTNLMLSRPLKKCTVETPCPNKAMWGFHPVTAQSGPSKSGARGSGSAAAVYPIPEKLLEELLVSMEETVPFTEELLGCVLDLVPW
jgi:hypothetical protein